MYLLLEILFFICCFIIFWAMIGYPLSLKILDKVFKKEELPKNYKYLPTVTLMIVAHNEEKIIKEKLENVLKLDYPMDKLEILVASDNSTDNTNQIVYNFIKENSSRNLRLFEVKERKGKTNAQNEAAKTVNSEILVMTDANAMLNKKAVTELVAAFYKDDIAYVSGRLCYINGEAEWTSESESVYWDLDTSMRDIESRFQTITAGNGAIYACRTKDYIEIDPIYSHDSSMPLLYALRGKKAICNHNALAYEKAGENIEDEFSRKVRMNRIILSFIMPNLKILNFFKYKWFTYFYLGHRTSRYLLWLSHILVFVLNILLIKQGLFFQITLVGQLIFYTLALLKVLFNINKVYLNMVYYYCVTIVAQLVGVWRIITGKAKPFWEKAESTR